METQQQKQQKQNFADSPKYGRFSLRKREKANVASVTVTDNNVCFKERSYSPNCSNSDGSKAKSRYERNMGFFRQLSRRFGLQDNDDLVFDAAASVSAEDDAQSSSTDSCSSTTECSQNARISSSSSVTDSNYNNALKCMVIKNSLENISGASSDASSADINDVATSAAAAAAGDRQRKSSTRSSFSHLQRRSTSIRRAFQRISLNSRSLSMEPSVTPQGDKSSPVIPSQKTSSSVSMNSSPSPSPSSSYSTQSKANKAKAKPPQRILRQPVSYTYLKGISGLPTQRVPRSAVCCQYARRWTTMSSLITLGRYRSTPGNQKQAFFTRRTFGNWTSCIVYKNRLNVSIFKVASFETFWCISQHKSNAVVQIELL